MTGQREFCDSGVVVVRIRTRRRECRGQWLQPLHCPRNWRSVRFRRGLLQGQPLAEFAFQLVQPGLFGG